MSDLAQGSTAETTHTKGLAFRKAVSFTNPNDSYTTAWF